MGLEITTGFLMFWGGIALGGASLIFAAVYLALSQRKASRLLKQIDDEIK